MVKKLKKLLRSRTGLAQFVFSFINYFPLNNRLSVPKGNKFICKGLLQKTKIFIKGSGNEIVIGALSRLNNTKITVIGNNNKIVISDSVFIQDGDLYIEDSNGSIEIGTKTSICGKTHLAVIEGCSINIGEDCLFSANVTVRTGDSHSILDVESRKRINPSQDVTIGDHVWVGNQVIVLKGAKIAQKSIVGSGSVVTKEFSEQNVVIAGVPAKVVKTNVDWDGQRI